MSFSHAKKSPRDYGAGFRDEIDRFKIEINLTEYAASQGYQIDQRASSRSSVVMRDADADKVIIARGEDQHWVYFSVRNDRDNGSIIDFIQYRRRCSLGDVRRELRPWIGGAVPRIEPERYVRETVPVSPDRVGVLRALSGMQPIVEHHYLEEDRAITRALLAHPRFAGKILVDARDNVIFPHANQDGHCGYEIKNRGFTGFAPGGEKGLWVSAVQRTDTALVIAESGLDALSYAALHADEHARYASFGGALNAHQPLLLQAAIKRLTVGATVSIATDNDHDGEKFASLIVRLVAGTERKDLLVRRALPVDDKDWNESLLRSLGRYSYRSVLPSSTNSRLSARSRVKIRPHCR